MPFLTKKGCLCRAAAVMSLVAGEGVHVRAQVPQPPDNYHGPDTYGMCVYVVGDTTYYGKTFYVSSYFRPKAEEAIREYAQAQANGARAAGHCYWAYRAADLAVQKETDQRLLGLPGHSAHGVESNWTYQGGTVGAGSSTGTLPQGGGSGMSSAANGGTVGSGVRQGAGGTVSSNAGGAIGARSSSAIPTTTYAPSGVAGTTVAGATGSTGGTGSTGSVLAGSRQSVADAKAGVIGSAASSATTLTGTALGGLNDGMQSLFHRRQGKTQQAAATPSPSPTDVSSAGGGMGMEAVAGGTGGGGTSAAAVGAMPASLEGLIADVSGREVIINVGGQAGLRTGLVMVVTHAQRTVNDPATGKPLRTVETQVGQITLTEVDATSATGSFVGTGVPVVGDKVKLKRE